MVHQLESAKKGRLTFRSDGYYPLDCQEALRRNSENWFLYVGMCDVHRILCTYRQWCIHTLHVYITHPVVGLGWIALWILCPNVAAKIIPKYMH